MAFLENVVRILEATTFCYRLGAELSVVPFGDDSQYLVRNSMPAKDELPSHLETVDVGIFGVGIDRDRAAHHRAEFILLAHTYLISTGVVHEGTRAKDFAAHMQEDDAMVSTGRVAALGQHYGLWKVVSPEALIPSGIVQTLMKLDSGFFFTEVQTTAPSAH